MLLNIVESRFPLGQCSTSFSLRMQIRVEETEICFLYGIEHLTLKMQLTGSTFWRLVQKKK